MKEEYWKKRLGRNDEHDMPTEPLPAIPAMLFPLPGQSNSIPEDRTFSAPFSPSVDPKQPLAAYPRTQNPYANVTRYPSYPVLPGTPPGTNYRAWSADGAWEPGNTKRQHTRRRRLLPACVDLFFVCVQLLLVVRFGVRLLDLPPDITWIGVVISVSEIFVQPFRELWFQIPSVDTLLPARAEIYTLVAILIYGVLARLLVSILKVILKSR